MFKMFFECNDTLLHSLDIMEKYDLTSFATHSNISFVNFCQGPLWQQKSAPFRAEGRIVLPYFLYADETEMNNGLGPHASPSFQVYYSFPFLDQSPLFTAAIIEKEVYKKYGNTRCLRPILEVLKSLEIDGIEILTSAGIKQVHFVLGLVLGDNAGINKMLGFKSCAATCGCRFCKMPQKDLKVTSKLDKNLLRSKASYAVDSVSADDSSGVAEACVFHLLPSFHVQENFFVDVMHDWFEGVSRYLLVHILNYCIKIKCYFTLAQLNLLKNSFSYGEIEIGNVFRDITAEHLKEGKIKCTAREMMMFIHLFPLIIGHRIPASDTVWSIFIMFSKINDILMSFEYTDDLLNELDNLIIAFNTDYLQIFNDTLKPKFHYLLHYRDVIAQSGPPRQFWCFRYEGFHKQFKAYAHVTANRRNLSVSLATKACLKFAYELFFLYKDIFVTFRASSTRISSQFLSPCARAAIIARGSLIHSQCIDFEAYSEIIYMLKKYKKGYYVSTCNNDNLQVYEIQHVVVFAAYPATPFLLLRQMKVGSFDTHLQSVHFFPGAYMQPEDIFDVISIKCFNGPPLNSYQVSSGEHYIRPKNYY